jgi:hypothetical protein
MSDDTSGSINSVPALMLPLFLERLKSKSSKQHITTSAGDTVKVKHAMPHCIMGFEIHALSIGDTI